MADTKTAAAEDVIRRAIADPGAAVPQGGGSAEQPDACTRCRRVVEHLHLFEGVVGEYCRDCAVVALTEVSHV